MIGFSLLLWTSAGNVAAQSALDGFDPNANGPIRVIVVQADGKILIGGEFSALAPNGGATIARNCIARLNPDGTVDAAFNPNATATAPALAEVRSIVVQEDGRILVGGQFNRIGGQTRQDIARLDPATGLADSFDPQANGMVFAIVIQPDAKIVIGGGFTQMGGQLRTGIARLDPVTGLADSFDPNANNAVYCIALQSDGKILVGGFFSGKNSIGGQVRNHIARLDPVTGLADSFDPDANDYVFSILIQPDGKILVSGAFNGASSIGGQSRYTLARLNATTGRADSFDPNPNLGVYTMALQTDGKILVGGFFTGPNSIGGQSRDHIARLDPATGLADSFDPNANFPVYAITPQLNGKILVGGDFDGANAIGGQTRNYMARLEANGQVDQSLDFTAAGSYIIATATQPDGKILIGGSFTSVLGVPRNNIARLNANGTLDSAFNPNADDDVDSIALQPDGNILAGGNFSNIGGQARNRIARLDATTGAADSFDPHANGRVWAMAVQADGKILVGGEFQGANSIGGQTRNRIARLDPGTGFADSFDPNANNNVYAIAIQADGKILVGGNFAGGNSIGGQTRWSIARLDATTGLADSFDPDANGTVGVITIQADTKILLGGTFSRIGNQRQPRIGICRVDPTTGAADSFDPNPNFSGVAAGNVYSIAVQADGKILVGGYFDSVGGQGRHRIARLDADTGLADSFDPSPSGGVNDADVYSVALQADGKILAGGWFSTIGGQSRNLFARLTNDTAALQDLVIAPGVVTWVLAGSSPQLARVTFESSTDNVTYTPLGAGAAAGANWTLTGLNLPTNQNIYIRARGYSTGGNSNGSEGMMESVKNAFLPEPDQAATPRPSFSPSPTPTATATATPTPSPSSKRIPTPSPTPTASATATPPSPARR